jgi:hypothetical protein
MSLTPDMESTIAELRREAKHEVTSHATSAKSVLAVIDELQSQVFNKHMPDEDCRLHDCRFCKHKEKHAWSFPCNLCHVINYDNKYCCFEPKEATE